MHRPKLFVSIFVLATLLVCAVSCAGQSQSYGSSVTREYVVPAGTILRLTLAAPLKPGRLRPGSAVEGELTRPVYVYDRQVIPAGSRLRAVVANVDKQRVHHKGFMEHLQAVRSLGLNRKYDYDVSFDSAVLTPPEGPAMPVLLRFIDAAEVVHLHTKGDHIQVGGTTIGDYVKLAPGVGKVESAQQSKKQVQHYRHPEVSMETEQPLTFRLPPDPAEPVAAALPAPAIPSGIHARLLLLDSLSASENKPGDIFHARALEPIIYQGQLLAPEGSMLEGHIARIVAPRRLSRAGSLSLVLDKLVLPNGGSQRISASLVGVESSRQAAGSIDEEGGLHGKGRGAKQTMKDFGVGLLSQQVVDEVIELGTHAVAPYVSIPMGLAMFLGGHGHDASLPRYSELEIVFGRSMQIGAPPLAGPSPDR